MVKVIAVTGSVATGKTTISKKLSKLLNYKYVNLKEFSKKNNLGCYNRKDRVYDIDIKKLNKKLIELIKNSKQNLILDGHISHYLSKKYVDLCIVVKCDIKKLKKRLEKRRYSKDKIRENLDVEIFDICLIEAKENKHNIYVIDTSKKYDLRKIKI